MLVEHDFLSRGLWTLTQSGGGTDPSTMPQVTEGLDPRHHRIAMRSCFYTLMAVDVVKFLFELF